MAEETCFCAATSHDHTGVRCGYPAKFVVETQAYQGEGKYGPLRMIGICEKCWERIQEELPASSETINRKAWMPVQASSDGRIACFVSG